MQRDHQLTPPWSNEKKNQKKPTKRHLHFQRTTTHVYSQDTNIWHLRIRCNLRHSSLFKQLTVLCSNISSLVIVHQLSSNLLTSGRIRRSSSCTTQSRRRQQRRSMRRLEKLRSRPHRTRSARGASGYRQEMAALKV